MNGLARGVPRLGGARPWFGWTRPHRLAEPGLLGLVVGAALAGSVGAAIGTGRVAMSAGLAVLLVAFAVALVNWRWSVYGLLLYLPFSGIPIILTYPHTTEAVLIKDFVFVIPAYVGFAAEAVTRRARISFDGAPVAVLGLLAVLVIVQAVNPSLPNQLVGLVGAKVWLLYIPLLFVGYHLIDDRRDLRRLLTLIVLSGLAPAVIGIAEALMIYAGNGQAVHALYGDAAQAATQNFTRLTFAGASIERIPSTFSYVTQYFLFTAAMAALAYAWWRGVLVARRRSLIGLAAFLLFIVASLLSGARAAFLFVPIFVALAVLLDRSGGGPALRTAALSVGGLGLALAVLGSTAGGVIRAIADLSILQFDDLIIEETPRALSMTVLGLGAGADTIAARHVTDGATLVESGFESWYLRVLLELGVMGLLLVLLLMASLVIEAYRRHRGLRDPGLRAISAALIAFLVWCLLSNLKNQYVDLDPLNVYFWLFLGILFKLAVLDSRLPGSREHAAVH